MSKDKYTFSTITFTDKQAITVIQSGSSVKRFGDNLIKEVFPGMISSAYRQFSVDLVTSGQFE